MKKLLMCSVTSAAMVAAGALYGQDVGAGAGAQAGPGGASAQAGGAEAQAAPGGAAAQAGTNDAAAGASTQSGAGVQAPGAAAEAQPGTDAGLQANPPPVPSVDAGADPNAQSRSQLGGDANAQAGANAQGDTANRPALGVTLSGSGEENLMINSIQPGSPAAQAGLQQGDQIVSFNGEEVTSTQAFVDTIRGADLNGSGELVILRGGERQTMNINFVPWNQVYSSQPYFAMRPNFDAGPGGVQGQVFGGPGYGQPQGFGGGYGQAGWGDPCACQPDPCCQPAVYTSASYGHQGSHHGRRGRHRCW